MQKNRVKAARWLDVSKGEAVSLPFGGVSRSLIA